MRMAESVTIPVSVLELTLEYESPDFRLWLDRASIVQAVFDALSPWEPRFDDVDAVTTGKPTEQGFAIKLPLKRISFFFGAALCKFTRENVNWEMAEETITVLDAGVSALTRSSRAVIGLINTAVSLHIQPKSVPFMKLLAPLIAPQVQGLDSEPIITMATVAKWPHRKVTIDGSGLVANAVFLRSEREFLSTAGYNEIAERLRDDQGDLFKLLGLEEDRA
jgi:hypothetical protein